MATSFIGCTNSSLTEVLSSIEKSEGLPAYLEIVQAPQQSQSTFTSLSPSLKVRVLDNTGETVSNPADISIELIGSNGTLHNITPTVTDGMIEWNQLEVTTPGTAAKIKVKVGLLESETPTFDLTTKAVNFQRPTYVSPIDGDQSQWAVTNTLSATTSANFKTTFYKKADTNNNGIIDAGDSNRWVGLPAGSRLTLANGTYDNVGKLYIGGVGEPNKPVIIEAATPGGVVFTGSTEIYIWGSYVIFSGIRFQNVKPTVTSGVMGSSLLFLGRTGTSSIITPTELNIPTSYSLKCNSCALRYNKVDNSNLAFDPGATPLEEFDTLGTAGVGNEISHNTFIGRNNPGHFIVIWRTDGVEDKARIYNNEFLDQVYASGANGNEVLRIGTGADTYSSSKSIFENNLVENADGEIETISVKSWDNTIRFNTFRNNKGSICVRSAGRTLIEANYILGMNKSGSGGIRAIHEGNLIIGNHIQDTNPGSPADMSKNSALVLPMGTNNPEANYYFPVKDTKIAMNTFVNNKLTWNIGADAAASVTNDTIAPTNVTLAFNFILGRNGEPYADLYSPLANLNLKDNYAANGLFDSTRTSQPDFTSQELPSFAIVTNTWNSIERPEDPMRNHVRITTAKLIQANLDSTEIARITSINASIYDIFQPHIRGTVGCGF
ncbi:chondroitinase-B domain-containing protein [Bdellovibrio sp. HCB2-146]|uniref:chondroitinase-B domain-containing protein n=1 Tax=Bdellovibrio sp. HCB2-146 TaxID=3394362 RepID=UPI0039BCED6E